LNSKLICDSLKQQFNSQTFVYKIEKVKKAIIVEDFELIADIWKTILEDIGFTEIEIIRHADEVESKVLEIIPDIILMDINLPGAKNGIELTESLIKQNDSLKVMILTIHTDPSYVQNAIKVGAKGFMTKNSSISEIKKGISEILSGKIYLCEEVR
jgi:two-component system invasion response regulator UvrY